MILTDRSKLIKALIPNTHHWVLEGHDTQVLIYGDIKKLFRNINKDKVESYLYIFSLIRVFVIDAKALSKLIKSGDIKQDDEIMSLTPNDAISHLGNLLNFVHGLSDKFQISTQIPKFIFNVTE
jgi:hypothetical protein